MKTVYLLRHGKSDWEAPFDHDHERPLAKRGRKAAKRMGRFLRTTGQTPDFIISSTAVRARGTLELAQQAGDWDAPTRLTEALYLADPGTVIHEVRSVPDDAESVLLVSHEPTCSETISMLVGGGDVRFPTAAMARIDLEVRSWAEADEDTGILQWMIPPKMLKG